MVFTFPFSPSPSLKHNFINIYQYLLFILLKVSLLFIDLVLDLLNEFLGFKVKYEFACVEFELKPTNKKQLKT